MLHIYYGLGKGKTSNLNGMAVRTKGAGMRVGLFRFLKGRKTSEDPELKKLGITVIKFHPFEEFVIQLSPENKLKAREAHAQGLNYILANKHKFDVILLDEFLDMAVDNVGFFTKKQLKEFLLKLKDKEVLVSGHEKNEEVFSVADLITYYNPEKHYFEKGIKARKGIEF